MKNQLSQNGIQTLKTHYKHLKNIPFSLKKSFNNLKSIFDIRAPL
ncbi:hypothetical protein LEP1GSC066_1810 [Leptospira sp. serovar Kenya str. Sh9]|nr:hypothetical protein LEP1GSC066_1810 [Leptospira sp. serovar Kenya str. Sh9]